MGYTHYWEFKKPAKIKGEAQRVESLYQRAVADCNKIIQRWQRENPKGSDLDGNRLSGYSAHVKGGIYGGVNLNGKGSNGHEDFFLREHYNQNEDFEFCKTAQKPYDTVVVACLAVLKHRLGDLIHVNSDGDASDWQTGVDFARKCTRLKIQNPIRERVAV